MLSSGLLHAGHVGFRERSLMLLKGGKPNAEYSNKDGFESTSCAVLILERIRRGGHLTRTMSTQYNFYGF